MEIVATQLAGTVSNLIESSVRSLLKEDEAVISRGASMETKQELRELDDHINYASFLLAANVSHIERQPINGWISEARKTAFCLADQIDMYAIQSPSDFQLYDMKCDIGMLSIKELTYRVKRHRTVDGEQGEMPPIVVQRSREPENREIEDAMELSGRFPFIRPSVPQDAIIKMDDKIKKIEAFFTGPRSVLFITGGQGSGKTTLMKGVYDSKKERMNPVHGTVGASPYGRIFGFLSILSDLSLQFFFKKCKDDFDQFCWVDIPETGGLVSLLKKVLKESNVDCDSIDEFKVINTVRDTFKDKHCLIVLDNVQDEYVLYSLMTILQNLKWKIVCLSRKPIKEDKDQDVLHVPGLQSYDSLKLLLSAAFGDSNNTIFQRENFNSTDDVLRAAIRRKYGTPGWLQSDQLFNMVKSLKDILSKCQGNPSNIWNIGRQLQVKPPEKWKEIVEQMDDMLIDGTKIKRDPHIEFKDATLADAAIRHCFLYCLAFSNPKKKESSEIPTKKLMRLWAAEGFVQDSASKSEEQEAERLLQKFIAKNLLVEKKKDFDGKVLKCSVNKHIWTLANEMGHQQMFCNFVPDNVAGASSSSRMTRCLPISRNILGRGKKKPLSDRFRMMAVHPPDRGVEEVPRTHTVGSFPSVSWSKKKEVTRTIELGTEIRLRSLLYFNTGRIVEDSKLDLSFGRTYMLLRTLELQGARLAKLPPHIEYLVCLRYLGLRNTQLEDLPPTWKSLRALICLDIRDTNIAEVADVSLFSEMRHLYLTNSFRSHSVAITEGLHLLDNLQTLSGATYGESSGELSFEEQISHLRHLRKLSVKKASCTASSTSRNICQVISGIDSLQSLAISCDRDGQEFDLCDLKIGKKLCKLKLGGPMGNFCDLEPLMQSITFLYLWDSKLNDLDLLHTLQGLTCLLVLSLLNTSTKGEMRCDDGGYKRLKKLSIISMQNLSGCHFGQNAMQNLEELVFAKCGKLKSLPQGLDQLGSLREVHLTEMLPDFRNEAQHKLGDKVHVLRDALSHVVSSRAAAGGGS